MKKTMIQQNKLKKMKNVTSYFDKGGKNVTSYFDKMEKASSKFCWESCTEVCKLVKLENSLTPCTKINPK